MSIDGVAPVALVYSKYIAVSGEILLNLRGRMLVSQRIMPISILPSPDSIDIDDCVDVLFLISYIGS
jgi:hypothetical protein